MYIPTMPPRDDRPAGDLVLEMSPFCAPFAGDVFRDEEYVREELISMAQQAYEADSKATQARNN